MKTTTTPQDEIMALMESMGFDIDRRHCDITALTGGVSADIWRIETSKGPVVVKRALAQLRVKDEWEVPVSRNQHEVDWLETVAAISPGSVPRILASDREAGLFVMDYLAPETHPVWKNELATGAIEEKFAGQVAGLLARIHSKTAGNMGLAKTFDTDELFNALRPAPYFLAAGARNPELKEKLEQLTRSLFENKKALVHGDISPKNILHGPRGPIFLDAECAWYGDPAFDIAFCLNHLLLKTLWQPQWSAQYLQCFTRMRMDYFSMVNWESPSELEKRVAHLLPALLLGRIDGKSPVEYITAEEDRDRVRVFAKQLILNPVTHLTQLQALWVKNITSSPAKLKNPENETHE